MISKYFLPFHRLFFYLCVLLPLMHRILQLDVVQLLLHIKNILKQSVGESPPLSKMAKDEVLILRVPKSRKMNGEGLKASKASKIIGQEKKKASPPCPYKNHEFKQQEKMVFETGVLHSPRSTAPKSNLILFAPEPASQVWLSLQQTSKLVFFSYSSTCLFLPLLPMHLLSYPKIITKTSVMKLPPMFFNIYFY